LSQEKCLSDEEVIFVSDIYPTGFEMGVRNGQVDAGDVVVCIGAGPVGMAAMSTARLRGARRIIAVDLDQYRLDQAKETFGATHTVNSGDSDWKKEILDLTAGRGADVVMEAVGVPATLEAAFDIVRPYGHVANIGVHGHPVTVPMDRLWIQNITLTMGLVDGVTAPMLISLVEDGALDLTPMGTHSFALDDIESAYETFANAAETHALKVVLRR